MRGVLIATQGRTRRLELESLYWDGTIEVCQITRMDRKTGTLKTAALRDDHRAVEVPLTWPPKSGHDPRYRLVERCRGRDTALDLVDERTNPAAS